jgi:predicted NBD/HSP70 family sugar kinase
MNVGTTLQTEIAGAISPTSKRGLLLRLIRACQPISRTEIAERLRIDKSTVTENVKPLIDSGILREDKLETRAPGRRARMVLFADEGRYFAGVNLGVRRTQVGLTTLAGVISDEADFETPSDPAEALDLVASWLSDVRTKTSNGVIERIGVSVPGMTDADRGELVFAPNLNWRDVDIRAKLGDKNTRVVVENDSTAAAMFEARLMIRDTYDGLLSNFVLVRSGTGIGVGLVIGGEVFRGAGISRGIAGEFGHMTIVAGGKQCVCGNRGCWERYASAAAGASLYLGDRPLRPGETTPRFVEIVAKAENGDNRSRRTLELIGDYLGVGIANVIMGVGIPRVIISGRLVYGWQFIEGPLNEAIRRSIVGKTEGWSVEAGSPVGSAIGGALEVAIEDFLASL